MLPPDEFLPPDPGAASLPFMMGEPLAPGGAGLPEEELDAIQQAPYTRTTFGLNMELTEEPEAPEEEDPLGGALVMPGLFPERLTDAADYRVRLDEAAREALARRVCEAVETYLAATEERRLDLAREWRRDARAAESDQPGPWPGASALRAPFTAIACANHSTRLNSQLLGSDPPLAAIARRPEAVEHAPKIEEVMRAVLEECGWAEAKRGVHKELPVVSPCAVRATWRIERRMVPDLQVDLDLDVMGELADAGVDPRVALAAATNADEQGRARVRLEWKEKIVHDGVHLEVVPYEDLVYLPHTARNIEQVWGIGQRVLLRGTDLDARARDGVYDREAVDRVLLRHSDPTAEDREDALDLAGLEADLPGGAPDHDALHRTYELYELSWRDSLDGDRREKQHLLTVHLPSRTLLRVQYSPHWHTESEYTLYAYNPSPGELHGESVAERCQVLQDAATAALNQFLDMADLVVAQSTMLVLDERANLRPDKFEWRPGKPMFVENIAGVMHLPLSPAVGAAMQQLSNAIGLFREWVELLTASSNPALGRETSGQKTLGEVQAVLGQAMTIFEDYASSVALCDARVLDQVRWLYRQYAQNHEVTYRRAARPQPLFETIPAEILEADVDLVPAGMNAFPDASARLQRDLLVMQTVQTHPATAQDMETQLDVLDQLLQDVKWPGRETLIDRARQRAEALAMLQDQLAMQGMAMQDEALAQGRMGAEAQLQGAATQDAQAQAQMERDARRAELEEAGMALDLAGKAQGLAQPPAPKNGKGK